MSKRPLTQHVTRSPHAGCLCLIRDSMTDTARSLWYRKADPLLGAKHFLVWHGRTRHAQFEQGSFSLILCLLFLYSVSKILLLKKTLTLSKGSVPGPILKRSSVRAKKTQLPLGVKELQVKDVFIFCSATTTLYATFILLALLLRIQTGQWKMQLPLSFSQAVASIFDFWIYIFSTVSTARCLGLPPVSLCCHI